MTLEEGLWWAMQEWQHASNFDRMKFYEMAEKFLEFEAEEEMQIRKSQWMKGPQCPPPPALLSLEPQGPLAPEVIKQPEYLPSKAGPKAPTACLPPSRPQRPVETKAHLPQPRPQRPAETKAHLPPPRLQMPAETKAHLPPPRLQMPAETKAHLPPPRPQRPAETKVHLPPSRPQRPAETKVPEEIPPEVVQEYVHIMEELLGSHLGATGETEGQWEKGK
ncbi:NUT family member 2F-like, partial [Hylobates moloch]|uniref:NUT family member 2F-like n=1 Tax=Hylobates moloch TaxID=81572 RepID=UPI0026767DF2